MKLNGIISRVINANNKAYVEFEVPTYQTTKIEELSEKELQITLSSKKEVKSSQQRKYAWVIITKIDKAINGGFSTKLIETYKNLLKHAKINPIYLETIPEAKAKLEKMELFRVIETIESRQSDRGIDTELIACYPGISKLNKEEMINLIEVMKMYAQEYQINIDEEWFNEIYGDLV